MHTSGSRVEQQGLALLGMTVILFLIAIGAYVALVAGFWQAKSIRLGGSLTRTQAIQKALIGFAAREGRLPCPADGSLLLTDQTNRGVEDSTCTAGTPSSTYQATGIVPWRALALNEEDVINAYGNYYSYRVFAGPTGFTRSNGITMSACDTDNTPKPSDPTVAVLDCEAINYDNIVEQFLVAKGLTVSTADNTTVANVAFVIVDHGVNQRGARNPSGSIVVAADSSRPEEVANASGITLASYSGTFYSKNLTPELSESSSNYVDDVVIYQTISDLAKSAGRYARNWPDNVINASLTSSPNTASTDAAAPHFVGTQNTALVGSDFAAVTDASGTTLSFGASSSTYAGCLWLPVPLSLFDGTSAKPARVSLEFALQTNTSDVAPGFAVGFIPATASSGPPTNNLCGTTRLSLTGTQTNGSPTLGLNSTVGVLVGQRITGTSGGGTILINAVSPTALTLSLANTGAVSGAVTFASPSVTKAITSGDSGSNFVTVADLTGIVINSVVTGTGIAWGARVQTASGNTVRLSRPNIGVVSGNAIFAGPTVTTTATGSNGSTLISVPYPYGLTTGMVVSGNGIATAATVSTIANGSVTLSANRTATSTVTVSVRPVSTSDITRDLGWAGGALSVAYPDRFALEVDTRSDSTASDPSPFRTHFSVDQIGVTHNGTIAASCAGAASGGACDQHPTSSTFLIGGSSSFNILRLDLIPNQYCQSVTATGTIGLNTVDVTSANNLAVGMSVVGHGVGPAATVVDITGTTVTLSKSNDEAFTSQTLTFHSESLTQSSTGTATGTTLTVLDSSVLANGLTVSGTGVAIGTKITAINSATSVTISPPLTANVNSVLTFGPSLIQAATGSSGSSTLTVVDSSVLAAGIGVTGTGIADQTKIASVDSATSVTLSAPLTVAVSGDVSFLLRGQRVVAKGWVLSNTGCASAPTTCASMRNVNAAFTSSLKANVESLEIAECIAAPAQKYGYDSLYLGLTTSNGGSTGANVYFKNLLTN